MTDIRARLPECPLEYEVPLIPAFTHRVRLSRLNAADIDWQEKMLPWTLASFINNTDIVMQGVHLYIVLAPGIKGFRDRIQNALSRFDLPEGTITEDGTNIPNGPTILSICLILTTGRFAITQTRSNLRLKTCSVLI